MSLFKFGKKKEEKKSDCNCSCNCNLDTKVLDENTKKEEVSVKVLGSGCTKCNQLEEATKEALSSLGMNDVIEHVKDFEQIAAYGVMSTPALVVDGKVVSYGKVLKKEEIINILKEIR